MKLYEIMLDLAKLVSEVYEGTVTTGATTSITDTGCSYPAETFKDGTIWITSGTYLGTCKRIKTHGENKFTFDAIAGAPAAGVTYAVAPGVYFPLHVLKQACNLALAQIPIIKVDETLTTIAGVETYTLPTGVSDIHRVEVATATAAPYGYLSNHFWKEANGTLYFYANAPAETGYKLRIWYMAMHDACEVSGTINDGVPRDYLLWAAAVNAYRRLIEIVKKDNPTALDLLNEAKQKEAEAIKRSLKYPIHSMPYDVRYAAL